MSGPDGVRKRPRAEPRKRPKRLKSSDGVPLMPLYAEISERHHLWVADEARKCGMSKTRLIEVLIEREMRTSKTVR
jgi:hypothetical protein